MQSKSIFESKTFWASAFSFVIGLVNLLVAQPFLPPELLALAPVILGVLGVLLRWVTDQPVSLSGSK